MEGLALLRILLHKGIKEEDFDISWFIVRIKWQKFMKKVLMMTTLIKIADSDGKGIDCLPKGHKIYNSLGKSVAGLKDEDGDIWNVGHF